MGRERMKNLFISSLFIFSFTLLISVAEAQTSFPSSNSQQFINQLFSEQTLIVTKEGDEFLSGTFRTVLMQAMGIRQNNPFAIVSITFDPSIKKIRISKGNLPFIDKGLISIDCLGKVTLDGSQINPSDLQPNEKVTGIYFRSSGNILKGCRLVGFKGSAVVVAGNRNQIRGNFFGEAPKNPNEDSPKNGIAISLVDEASDNVIESNEFINNKQEGIVFSPQTGAGNRIVSNVFGNNSQKEIQANQNYYQTTRLNLRPIVKEGDEYIISGTVSEPTEVELLMDYSANKENKLTTVVPAISLGKGDFSLSIKNKGFAPGVTKIFALATAMGRNTSDFSDPVTIPVDPPKITPPVESVALKEVVKSDLKESSVAASANQNSENEEKKGALSNIVVKPINERAASALTTGGAQPPPSAFSAPSSGANDPSPVAYQPPIPSFAKPNETTINLSSNPKKSVSSDSVKTDSPFEPVNAP